MGTVTWVLEAQEAKAVAGIMKVVDSLSKGERATDRMNQAGKKSHATFQDASKSALKFVGAVAGIGSALGSVMLIAAQLRREYEHLKRVQAETAATHMGVGGARGAALYNKPTHITAVAAEALVARAAKFGGAKMEDTWRIASTAFSAMGPLKTGDVEKHIGQAALVQRLSGFEGSTLAGGTMDIQKATGVGAKQSLGWMRQIGQAARVVDLEKQVRSVPPVIMGAKQYGFTPEQGAELFATMTQLSGDVMGRKSSTGTVNLMQTIMAGQTQGGALIPYWKKAGMGKARKMGWRTTKAGGMAGLAELQDWYAGADEGLRTEFKAKMPGEAKNKGAILGLIARDPQAMAVLAQAQQQIGAPGGAAMGGYVDRYIADVGKGKTEAVREGSAIMSRGLERAQLDNPNALAGVFREGLQKLAGAYNFSDINTKLATASFEWNTNLGSRGVLEAGLTRVEQLRRATGFQTDAEYWKDVGVPGGELISGQYGRNAGYRPGANEALNELAAELRALRAEIAKGNIGSSVRPPNSMTE